MIQLFLEVKYAHDKLKLYMYVHNQFVDYPKTQAIASSFFALSMNALQNDSIISTAKLFDKGNKSYGTIHKFFQLIEVNADLFQNDKKRVLKEIPTHQKFYEEKALLLQNLLTWRNKHFAHPDKNYFLDKDRLKLGEDAPILYGDLPDLLQKSVDIINFYSEALCKNHHILKDPEIERHVDDLFRILNDHLDRKT
ncbi:hypothetical protein [Paenibacillus sp. LPE1-1-1.1]|uniref:AbiU2 domain-containing protein n=1 Tax=Paenibacillus sp. LPE1-1-1.1 TaxID=3135230 RepID=UPI003428ABA0